MAHSLQLKVVAEGVETQEQFDFLCKLGCDQIQGYYFSKPIPSNEVVMLLFKLMKSGGQFKPAIADDAGKARKILPAQDGEKAAPAAQGAEPQVPAPQADAGKAPAAVGEKPAFDMLDFKIELPTDTGAPIGPVETPEVKEA